MAIMGQMAGAGRRPRRGRRADTDDAQAGARRHGVVATAHIEWPGPDRRHASMTVSSCHLR